MSRYLLGLATGVAIGVYIGLRLVWAEEPTYPTRFVESTGDEVEATVSSPSGTYTIRGRIVTDEGDSWALAPDPYLTTLTEGGNPR